MLRVLCASMQRMYVTESFAIPSNNETTQLCKCARWTSWSISRRMRQHMWQESSVKE